MDLELASKVVELLNDALELDRFAIQRLIEHRVPCNSALAEHPTIQAGKMKGYVGEHHVGMLGILNGLCGVDMDGWGPIEAVFDGNTPDNIGRLVRFQVRGWA